MRLITLLMVSFMLGGNSSLIPSHSKTMGFIKKNEGKVLQTYPDGKFKRTGQSKYSGCWGNQFDENGKRFKHVTKFTHTWCEKIFYTHYFKRTIKKIPKHIIGNKFTVYADTIYQWGSFSISKMKSHPERGRLKLWHEKDL